MDCTLESLEEFIDTQFRNISQARVSTPMKVVSWDSSSSSSSMNTVSEEVQEEHVNKAGNPQNPQNDQLLVNSEGNSQHEHYVTSEGNARSQASQAAMDIQEARNESDIDVQPCAESNQPSASPAPAPANAPASAPASVPATTPTALISLLRRTITEGGKRKRVDGSPIQASQNLSEDQAAIAEGVFESLVRVMNDYLANFTSKLTEQVETAIERHKDEIDLAMNVQAQEIAMLTEELNSVKECNLILEGRLTRSEKMVEELKERSLYQEARSMRDNLVFYNIKEASEGVEDTKAVLRGFLREEMRIGAEDMQQINFDRVHRVGAKNRNQPRIIVAKFNPGFGKDIVLRHGKNLDRAKNYGVNEQLPQELEQRKKQLLPQFKAARSNNEKPKWALDKLVVGNKVIQVPKDTVRNINTNTIKLATEMKIRHAPHMEHDKDSLRGPTTYQGHTADISSQEDIIPALHAIYADYKVARASHNTYAYRIRSAEGRLTEHFQDDGDHGAGHHLLKLMQEKDITNRLVCVTTWSSGARLGRARYEQMLESASLVLGRD